MPKAAAKPAPATASADAGAPAFKPTPAQRAQVKAMAGYGVPQFDIANVIGCSPPTLRVHFWQELETAAIVANAKVAQTLFRIATQGTGKEAVTAAIFWLKCRAGWRDVSIDPPGKKDEARDAASRAGFGTEWGDDLAAPTSSEGRAVRTSSLN
jgi:hypothetical protein